MHIAPATHATTFPSGYPYRFIKASLVCFTASLYFFYEFLQLNMFNAIDPFLMQAFHMNAAALGHLSAYYFYANILFLFPAGIILDRASTRKAILTAMSLSVCSTAIFAIATHIWIAELCRFVTGSASAFCFLSCMRLASRWFLPKHLGVVMGLVVTMAMLGGMVAQTPLTWLMDTFGWRKALMIDALCGAAILIAIFVIVRDFPAGAEIYVKSQHQTLIQTGFWKTLIKALKNSQNWLAGVYTACLNLPIFLLGAIWGSLYLTQAHHLTHTESTNVTSFIFIGTIVGSPFIGWLSGFMGRRKLPMIICALLSLAIIEMIINLPHISVSRGILLFFALGFFTSAQIISYPLIAESNPAALTGTASGLAATLIMAGGLLQPCFGWLMELKWNHTIVNGIGFYSAANYQLAMTIIPVGFVLGLIAALCLRETKCRGMQMG